MRSRGISEPALQRIEQADSGALEQAHEHHAGDKPTQVRTESDPTAARLKARSGEACASFIFK